MACERNRNVRMEKLGKIILLFGAILGMTLIIYTSIQICEWLRINNPSPQDYNAEMFMAFIAVLVGFPFAIAISKTYDLLRNKTSNQNRGISHK